MVKGLPTRGFVAQERKKSGKEEKACRPNAKGARKKKNKVIKEKMFRSTFGKN